LRTDEFEYDLPPELIAQTPIEPRDAARLLVLHRGDGHIEHRSFSNLLDYLRPGDLLVANESRVVPARLFGHKDPTGGRVEMLLLNKRSELVWEVLLKPGRRVKNGAVIAIEPARVGPELAHGNGAEAISVTAKVIDVTVAGSRVLQFNVPIEPYLQELGTIPLPPYIHTHLERPERYQTVYARVDGSVAAPTAGLHFTEGLLAELDRKGVQTAFVTLDVGLDTFRPVQEHSVEEHRMHSERCELPAETCAAINSARAEGRRVIAVGTTAVRVLETAGGNLQAGQQELRCFEGDTSLFIYPGFQFRVVQGLITNFHLPRSTLLMLVAAFAGKEQVDLAYAAAMRERYRFYSFGDAMLIL
jgi:S-adenosylmethionine:tRNA ribosyltransferase-isomerase